MTESELQSLLDADSEPDRLRQIEREIQKNRQAFCDARDQGLDDEAERIRLVSRPLFDARREIQGLRVFRRVAGKAWFSTAEDEILEAAMRSPAIKRAVAKWQWGTNLLFVGPTSTGKSVALAMLLKRACLTCRAKAPRWFYARSLAASPLQHSLGEGEAPEVEWAKECDLLILDDLGHERDHGALLDVVHHRYEHCLHTWSSSGLAVEQLTDRYGEAFVRRLVECGGEDGVIVDAFPRH